jgi:tRNA(Ile)-lysidine synthase
VTDPFISAACRGFAALHPPDRVLLAVSGGADSVAMLDALWSGRARRDLRATTFVVGHYDHALRSDSHRDRELAGELAAERGLAFVHARATGRMRNTGGLEEASREARYGALEALALANDCRAIVTAHTATDQAETLLWRLVRGAGARGLGAMRPSRKLGSLLLLRPLLGVTRSQTRGYCARRSLTFLDDPTNLDGRPRARLREEVLPVLERLAPGAVMRLAAAADRLRADDDLLEARASAEAPNDDAARIAGLPAPLRRRALAAWAARLLGTRRRLTATHMAALEALVGTGRGAVELPGLREVRRVAVVEKGRLSLREEQPRTRRSGEENGVVDVQS